MTYSYTSNAISPPMGHVNNEKVTLTTGVIPITGLDGDAANNELISFSNPTRQIQIKGYYVDTSIANLKTNFIDVWGSVINTGDAEGQISGTLVSDLSGTFTGKIMGFNYEYKEGEVISLTYELTFVQGV